jgi:hypothetical protein
MEDKLKSVTMWMAWHPKKGYKPDVFAKTRKGCLWEIERSICVLPNKEIGWYAYRVTIIPVERVN